MEKRLVIKEDGPMLSGYWSGTPSVGLFVYPNAATTVKELKTMLIEEVNMMWDHIEYVFRDTYPNPVVLETKIFEAVHDFFKDEDMERKPFLSIEFPKGEDEDMLPWIVSLEIED